MAGTVNPPAGYTVGIRVCQPSRRSGRPNREVLAAYGIDRDDDRISYHRPPLGRDLGRHTPTSWGGCVLWDH
jgi:hypothetical protein